jgi:hypothetical protein
MKEKNMKSKILVTAFACLALAPFIAAVSAQDNSPSNPAAIGTPVKSLVEIGSVYSSNYDITITVLETARGVKAMDLLKQADPQIKPTKAGFEYVLARVKFEIKGRAVSDNRAFDLGSSPLQWVAYSADITEYESISVTLPKPGLTGLVRPGETLEGWVAFAIEQKERKPIMTFDPNSGGATGRGRTLFFKLY